MGWSKGITDFFSERLRAPLRNSRWAWGAISDEGNVVFLRVWEDHLRIHEGQEQIRLLDIQWADNRTGGMQQRIDQLELVRSGTPCFAVICRSMPTTRSIKDFWDEELLHIGSLIIEDGSTWAQVRGRVSVDEVLGHLDPNLVQVDPNLVQDLEQIRSRDLEETTRRVFADARVGQGGFRRDVLDLWGRKCAVSGISTLQAIRASHVKPWRVCTDSERLDPQNGLPLVANLDALFDTGMISFSDSGALLVSDQLGGQDAKLLIPKEQQHLRSLPLTDGLRKYLSYHRKHVFSIGE